MKQLKIKRLSETAIIPTRAHKHDAGLDFYADSMKIDVESNQVIYGTGIAALIEPDFQGKMYMRSSIKNKSLILSNGTGIIDTGYVGEITFVFNIIGNQNRFYKPGDKIGQMVIERCYYPEIIEVFEMPETERGKKGYGSSDNIINQAVCKYSDYPKTGE